MGKLIRIVERCVGAMSMVTLLALPLSGCGNKDTSADHDVAHQLFIKSVRMISVYIDSISNAPDSAALQRIDRNFNAKLTTLNYEFPPDIDLELNEEENDSLIRMHKRYVRMRFRRDSILLHPADSVAQRPDSTSVSVNVGEKTAHK